MPRQEARLVVSSCEVAGGAGKALALSDGFRFDARGEGTELPQLALPPHRSEGLSGHGENRLSYRFSSPNDEFRRARRAAPVHRRRRGSWKSSRRASEW